MGDRDTRGEDMALTELSADDHAAAMADYLAERNDAAVALGSRGPVRFDAEGNLQNSGGWTALMWAAAREDEHAAGIMCALLDAGADAN